MMVPSLLQDYQDLVQPPLFPQQHSNLSLFRKTYQRILNLSRQFLMQGPLDSFIVSKFPIRQMKLQPIQIFVLKKANRELDSLLVPLEALILLPQAMAIQSTFNSSQ